MKAYTTIVLDELSGSEGTERYNCNAEWVMVDGKRAVMFVYSTEYAQALATKFLLAATQIQKVIINPPEPNQNVQTGFTPD